MTALEFMDLRSDIIWYDGTRPFYSSELHQSKWKSIEMNDMIRSIQPHIIFNNRNCLPGDFGTPEGHITLQKRIFSETNPPVMFRVVQIGILPVRFYSGTKLVFTGFDMNIISVSSNGYGELNFIQKNDIVTITLPEEMKQSFHPVLKLECDRRPLVYRSGGMRIPNLPHPRY